MKICLVASRNGHGHARRLLYLGLGLHTLGAQITILCSETSLPLLRSESSIAGISGMSFEVVDGSYDAGLDGPFCASYKYQRPKNLEYELHKKFAIYDHVIGDNVLWPAEFAGSFLLHGHFLWVDYYRKQKAYMDKDLKRREEKDLCNIELTRKFLLSKMFTITSLLVNQVLVKSMPLMSYSTCEEPNFPMRTGKKSLIWLARGLTNSIPAATLSYLIEAVKSTGIEFVSRETFNLENRQKPSVVIGRPGMGTIRDILNYGVDFIPIEYVYDVELSHNVEVLSTNKLIRLEGNLIDSIASILASPLVNEIQNFWVANSVSNVEYASLCLEEL